MGGGVFGTLTEPRMRHPRGNLVGEPVLSDIDSRQVTSGMTVKNTMVSTSTKSAFSNAEMSESVHVCSSWMMNKALSAHGCAISAITSITLEGIEEYVC
jgi:hypothetical protein